MGEKKLPKTLDADEVAALMAAPNRAAPTGLRDLTMLTLMHRSGLRVGEVCGLHLRDVKLEQLQIHLRPEIAKGSKEAYAYLDDQTAELIRSWIVVRRKFAARKPHLFTTLKGGPVDRRDVWRMMQRRGAKAGIRKVTPHMLRHTYATELLRDGLNIREVQTLLRHSDIRTTEIYTHIVDVDLARKIRERGR